MNYDNIHQAIDVMTAWASGDPNRCAFPLSRITEYVRDGELVSLLLGSINLSALLLIELEAGAGKPAQLLLQELAERLVNYDLQ